jgi:hypothetical protein
MKMHLLRYKISKYILGGDSPEPPSGRDPLSKLCMKELCVTIVESDAIQKHDVATLKVALLV